MRGKLVNDDEKFINFINQICRIDTTKYEKIYSLKNNHAGCILFIKGKNYYFVCLGSGKPVMSEEMRIIELKYLQYRQHDDINV